MSDAKHTPFPVDPKSIDSLIAAAPDLLAACEEALIRLEELTEHGTRASPLAKKQLQAAIAKAKGGAA